MKRVWGFLILLLINLSAFQVWAQQDCDNLDSGMLSSGKPVCYVPVANSNSGCPNSMAGPRVITTAGGGSTLACYSANGNGQSSVAACNGLKASYSQFIGLTSSEVTQAIQQNNDSCFKASTVADQCCGNPASCITSTPSGNDDGSGGGSAGAEILGFVLETAVAIPGSISAVCGRWQDATAVATALTAYVAAKCQVKVQSCKSSCSTTTSQRQSDLQSAEVNRCPSEVITAISSVYYSYKNELDICGTSNNADFAIAQQGIGSALGNRFASMCKSQANALNPSALAFNTPNCLIPAQAASPFCQYQCDRPGAATSPLCAGMLASLGAPPGFNATGLGPGGVGGLGLNAKSLFNDIPNPAESDQPAVYGSPTASNAGLDVPAGGGASGGLGGGGGLPGGQGVAAGPGKGGGYDTGILRGIASGSGYSGGRMSTGTNGGFAGYGAQNRADNLLAKKFSLKDFLPGGTKGEPRSVFRGLASTVADISPAHDDIFKKVTNRFYQVCLRDALMDCDALKKVKPKN
jgi:hypothetical protein